jgi:hypothetical protein
VKSHALRIDEAREQFDIIAAPIMHQYHFDPSSQSPAYLVICPSYFANLSRRFEDIFLPLEYVHRASNRRTPFCKCSEPKSAYSLKFGVVIGYSRSRRLISSALLFTKRSTRSCWLYSSLKNKSSNFLNAASSCPGMVIACP